ncbi:hypothetical protein [Bacillus thuringiensis]|uniref:Uncharacterized protein n=1 Tax=Bacillus thuringiensis TaxID=1428 RepID=A0A9X6WRA3_BACTU|nr:hypothetical protein [Bacillus thuringiensis]PFJ42776.1 hypothetical protein COJ15_05390 [Bacillus thuringiensis]
MIIYVLMEQDYEGSHIFLVHPDKEMIMKQFYSERQVQVWKDGEVIRVIESKDRYNEELWME